MPAGRPTKYKKRYCDDLIKHMKQEFMNAKRLAWQEYQLFWEKMGVHGSAGKLKGFNSTSYIYNVKCRFRNSDTWKPIKEETEGHSFTFNMSYKPEELEPDDE